MPRRRRGGHAPWTRRRRRRPTDVDVVQPPEWSRYLNRLFNDVRRPGSFQSTSKLHKSIQKEGRYQLGTQRLRRWLQNQPEHSRNRAFNAKNVKRGRVIVTGINDQFDADLADYYKLSQANDGAKYVLVVIDVFSRYAWVESIKDKTNESVKEAFTSIFQRGQTPRRLRTDRGNEFTASTMDDFYETYNISHFFTANEPKANYAERFIKTLKSKLGRYMTARGSERYVDALQDTVDSYNKTYHNSIRMSPSEVSPENKDPLWWMQYKPLKKIRDRPPKVPPEYKYKVGDSVRIPHVSTVFGREYDARWTEEIFKIVERFQRQYINMYKVEDGDMEPVHGTFYESELQQVQPNHQNVWQVERIVEERGNGAHRQAFVKFKGWPRFYNRWLPYGRAQRDIRRQTVNNP